MGLDILSILTFPLRAYRGVCIKRDARRLLGLSFNHSEYDLHLAYRALVVKCHPSLGGSKDKMDRLNAAFDVLHERFHSTT